MDNLITTIKALNEKRKRCVYILIVDEEMTASTSKQDIDEYLKSDESIVTPYTDIDNVSLLYGFQMNIEELPFELDKEAMDGKHLWLLMSDGEKTLYDPYNTIEEITKAIEDNMLENPEMDISDFAVILGEECDLVMSVSSAGSYIHEKTVYK